MLVIILLIIAVSIYNTRKETNLSPWGIAVREGDNVPL